MIELTHTRPPSGPIRVLGIDPSLTCTGWALLESFPTRPQGLAIAHGYIIPFGADRPMHERIGHLAEVLHAEIFKHFVGDAPLAYCAIEIPENKPRPVAKRGFSSRSVLSLPNLGIPVGACITTALAHFGRDKTRTVAPSDWLTGDIPRVGGSDEEEASAGKDAGSDPHKVYRVRYAESVWSLKRDSLGPVSRAGNVADALFIARHTLYRVSAAATHTRGPSCTAKSTATN